jgi:hypothetical protein
MSMAVRRIEGLGDEEAHIEWLDKKDNVLRQDIFLVAAPGPGMYIYVLFVVCLQVSLDWRFFLLLFPSLFNLMFCFECTWDTYWVLK